MEYQNDDKERKTILTAFQWWLSASGLIAMVAIPLTIGVFYIIEMAPKITEQPNQYSVLYGFILGIVISLGMGYFYAGMARKRAE